jgi:hypothetical protein
VDELVEEGKPFEADVVPGVEHDDNNEEEECKYLRYCTTMLPDEYLAEEKRVWLLTREMELVLFEPSRPLKPRHESPLIRCFFGCESLVGSCTNSNCLCYNSIAGHGQMLRIVGLASGLVGMYFLTVSCR